MRIKILVLIILIGCFFLSFRVNAQLVVIASNTQQFSLGSIIETSREITLPKDATITLISSDGGTIKLNGPYKGKPITGSSAQNKSLIETLSEIAAKEGTSGLAVFRSSTNRPDIWAININKSGSYCVRDDQTAVLWSNRSGAGSKLKITPLGNPSKVTTLDWPSGQRVANWPDSLSLVDGESYSMQFMGSNKERQLKIRIIPTEYSTDAHRAAWAWENGCEKQARRMVRGLAKGN